MKIILLNLPDMPRSAKGYHCPLGLASLAAVLEKEHEIKVIDLATDYESCLRNYLKPNKPIIKDIKKFDPELVGIYCSTFNRFNVYFYANLIKEINPNIKVVLGGPHSLVAEDTVKNIKEVDISVVGEGEETIQEICAGRPLNEIKGIVYKDKEKVITTPLRPRITDLDTLPFPARHLFPMEKYDLHLPYFDVNITPVITSRGCPIGCKFCGSSVFWGDKIRYRSPVNVVNEIEQIFSDYPFIKGIIFFDDTFTFRTDRVIKICEEIKKRKLDFPWGCWTRVNLVNRELLKAMKNAGCVFVAFGVESGSERMLRLIGKKVKNEHVKRAIRLCKEVGIRPRLDLMNGLPYQTKEDMKMTLKFVEELKLHPDDVHAGWITWLLPGTTWFNEIVLRNHPDFSWVNPPSTINLKNIELQKDSLNNVIVPRVVVDPKYRTEMWYRFKLAIIMYSLTRYPVWALKELLSEFKGQIRHQYLKRVRRYNRKKLKKNVINSR